MLLGSGCWITAALLLPNALFYAAPPPPSNIPSIAPAARWLESSEWILRLIIFSLPCFYHLSYSQLSIHRVMAFAMIFSLLFYYYGWIRYFRKRDLRLLFTPLAGLPYPMAISPVLFLLFASILLHSAALAVFSLLFGMAHLAVSRNTASQILGEETAGKT